MKCELTQIGDAGQLCSCCGERLEDYSAAVVAREMDEDTSYTHPICVLQRDAEIAGDKGAGV